MCVAATGSSSPDIEEVKVSLAFIFLFPVFTPPRGIHSKIYFI